MIVVADSSPLVVLNNLSQIEVLPKLFECFMPVKRQPTPWPPK